MTRKKAASHHPAPAAASVPAADARYRVRARISVAGAVYQPGDVVDGAALPALDAHLAFGEVELAEEGDHAA